MALSPASWILLSTWVVLLGGLAIVSVALPPGRTLTTAANLLQCVTPLVANAGLLLNAASPYRRRNAFWILLALGCTLWLAGQILWTYSELVLNQLAPVPFSGDIVFFLHTVPMIGALALRPHRRGIGADLRFGYLDLVLLLLWWIYLYVFAVIPWQYISPDERNYVISYIGLYIVENLIFVAGLAYFYFQSRGAWRRVYAHLFGAALLYAVSSQAINVAIGAHRYYTGSLYDLPRAASFLWLGTAGILAYRHSPEPAFIPAGRRPTGTWPARLAAIGVVSMPILALWSAFFSAAPEPVREFRLALTLGTVAAGGALVYYRQHLSDRERLRLLGASQESLEHLQRLQTQFVQSEKLASLGQLAAGAAQEINNPLTAILGYSDLLADDSSLAAKHRALVEKIREQARRTKKLIGSLLSFARRVPVEKTLVDVNPLVANAVQFRVAELRGKNIRVDLRAEAVLPGVRGDPNQLLQVFFNIISNAVDVMAESGGGTLTVRTLREKNRVVVEFTDTGPGIQEPNLVFDPFYTTKPVGQGAGLGLSICYGIVQEHGGQITCFNRQQGGATFRVELPAIAAPFPQVPGRTPWPPIQSPTGAGKNS